MSFDPNQFKPAFGQKRRDTIYCAELPTGKYSGTLEAVKDLAKPKVGAPKYIIEIKLADGRIVSESFDKAGKHDYKREKLFAIISAASFWPEPDVSAVFEQLVAKFTKFLAAPKDHDALLPVTGFGSAAFASGSITELLADELTAALKLPGKIPSVDALKALVGPMFGREVFIYHTLQKMIDLTLAPGQDGRMLSELGFTASFKTKPKPDANDQYISYVDDLTITAPSIPSDMPF